MRPIPPSAGATRAGAALLLILLLGGCGRGEDEPAPAADGPPPPRTIVLAMFDAANPRFFGPDGVEGAVTPHCDALASEGVRFENAFSVATWTTPAVVSLLTGLQPVRHGVQKLGFRLSENAPALAAALAEAGWRTWAYTPNPNAHPVLGIGRGFEEYAYQQTLHASGAERYAAAVDRFLEASGDDPVFLFVHVLPPHAPYQPPAPWDALVDDGYAGPIDGSSEQLQEVNAGERELDDADLAHLRVRYAATVALADGILGAVREVLERHGRDDAFWAITGDHGEAFLEHDWLGHSGMPYDEQIGVPLILRPHDALAVEPGVREQVVSILDVPATLADAAGVEVSGLDGTSLLPLLASAETRLPREAVWGVQTGKDQNVFELRGVRFEKGVHRYWYRTDDRKVILARDGDVEVYDVEGDPFEQERLDEPTQAAADRLREILGGLGRAWSAERLDRDPDAAGTLREELKRLGYAGG